jgi:glutamyl/glutaminyl-tRNA synthetase
VQDVFETLRWLGFEWDIGPRDAGDFQANHSQRLRREEYHSVLSRLETYACDCSRSAIQGRGNASYDEHCRGRGLRFEPGKTAVRAKIGGIAADPVLWTREDQPAYHLVSVLDDVRLGVTHIVRGEDLRESSALQTALARALGLHAYTTVEHVFHPLLLGTDGKKLSKSAGSSPIRFRSFAAGGVGKA